MADTNRHIAASEVVFRMLRSLGLATPSSPAGATDATSVQIWQLLTECGQKLLTEHQWQIRTKTYTFPTVPGTLTYNFPSGYDGFIGMTAWNQTDRIPLIGPVTEQEWQMLQARQLGGTTMRLEYFLRDDKLEFYYVPDTPVTIAMSYKSRAWVLTSSGVYRDYVENDDDTVLYDAQLIIDMLKYKWREEKGFDVTASKVAYLESLNAAKGRDKPPVDLALSHRSRYPFLGLLNMPDTNYGGS